MCFNFIWNVTQLVKQYGKTPYHLRFKRPFKGPVWAFGCEVHFKPVAPNDKQFLHKFGPNTLPGIFVGYTQYENGGDWKKSELQIILKHDLENKTTAQEVHIRTSNFTRRRHGG